MAATLAAAASVSFAVAISMIVVVVIMAVPMPATAASAMFGDFSGGVCFHKVGDFVEYSGVLAHLFPQRLVLFRDGTKEIGGIPQKLGCELGVCWHFQYPFRYLKDLL